MKFIPMTEPLYDYLVSHGHNGDPLLAELARETEALGPIAMMQIAPEQGTLMSILVRAIGATSAIEVGTFTGYSALCVARALGPNGRLLCCDVSEEWTAIARRYWAEAGVAGRIDLRLAPALDTLDALVAAGGAGTYDLAFIDADKTAYLDYYERALLLLRPGGLLMTDNTLWSGRVADPEVGDADTVALRHYNEHLHRDARVDLSLVPIGDGLTLARKR